MICILLLPNFDAQFVTQLTHEIKSAGDDFELVGITKRKVWSSCGLEFTPTLGISDLTADDAITVIPNCDAQTILLTEPRIHRLVQAGREGENVLVAPNIAATLARIGMKGMRVVRSGQEFMESLMLQPV